MSEKTFSLKDQTSNKEYKLTLTSTSSSISLKVENKEDSKDAYEKANISLAELQKKNKIFKQSNDISSIVAEISKKIEDKKASIATNQCLLKLEYTNETNEPDNIIIELNNNIELSKLKEENERLRKENLELKNKLGNKGESANSNAQVKAAPASNTSNTFKAVYSKDELTAKTTKVTKLTENPWEAKKMPDLTPKDNAVYAKVENIFGLKVDHPRFPYKKGSFLDRLNLCLTRYKNAKGILEDIQKEYDGAKGKLDACVNKFLKGSPSQEVKNDALTHMNYILVLYQEFKELEKYSKMFELEVEGKGVSTGDKAKFMQAKITFDKGLGFHLAVTYQKMNNTFRNDINNFFVDRNTMLYNPEELKDILDYKGKLMFYSN